MKQEAQTEMESSGKEMETLTMFFKERNNDPDYLKCLLGIEVTEEGVVISQGKYHRNIGIEVIEEGLVISERKYDHNILEETKIVIWIQIKSSWWTR